MDSVREGDGQELVDLGVCNQHNRLFECYCTVCYCLICPSCLMFDAHKGHEVCKIEQGSKNLRNQISEASRQGTLRFQRTENVLLDIRHSKLTLEENKQKLLRETEVTFDQIIGQLRARKARFSEELSQHFDSQLELIAQAEEKWVRRQELCQQILELQKSKDDLKLIENAEMVVRSLEEFAKPLETVTVQLVNNLKTEFEIGGHSVGLREFLESVRTYLKKGDTITNQFRS